MPKLISREPITVLPISQVSYEPELGVGYIKIMVEEPIESTFSSDGGLNVDLSSTGQIIGLELLIKPTDWRLCSLDWPPVDSFPTERVSIEFDDTEVVEEQYSYDSLKSQLEIQLTQNSSQHWIQIADTVYIGINASEVASIAVNLANTDWRP